MYMNRVEWHPDKKNDGSPLGPIYFNGDWAGYGGHGEAISFAKDKDAEFHILGPLRSYAVRELLPTEKLKKRRKKRSNARAKCSRPTFEGLVDAFPTAEGMATLAWECYRRLSTQQQIAVLESMNDDDDNLDWIEERLHQAQKGS